MKLTRYNPLRELELMTDRISRMMNLGPLGTTRESLTLSDWSPSVDILEDDNTFTIIAELPGVKKEDVEAVVEDDYLVIRGERKEETEERNKRFHRVERCYGSFRRSFNMPDNVDPQNIEANFKDGLLHVTLHKTEQQKKTARQIEIR